MADDSSRSRTPSDSHSFEDYPTSKAVIPKTTPNSRSKSKTPLDPPKKSFKKQRYSNNDILVYVPNIPLSLPENELEQILQTRLKTTQNITPTDIKYYPKLGLGVIRLSKEADKRQLIHNVQAIVLDPKQNISITFVDELDSYIVLDRQKSEFPSADEVAHYYKQQYKAQELSTCELVSVQFPNIFHIVSNSLDDLLQVVDSPDFYIEGTLATVYSHADCSFFEDLPRNTTDAKISSAIVAQIGEKELPATSFCIQFDKKTGNAVVVAAKSVKKWALQGTLTIDGRNVSKKAKLAYRLLVSPVPHNFKIDSILTHELFANHIAAHSHINDHLILEIDDNDTYKQCIKFGAVRINNKTMHITEHATVSNPEACEIDAESWYETDMLEIKADIMTIIMDDEHPILHYKWNARHWIEQFKKVESTDRRSKDDDHTRHLLRITVMLNTIGVLRKQQYIVDNEEVVLKSKPMRTIVYDHKSKLSIGNKIPVTDMKTPYSSTTVKVVNEDCLVLYEKLVSEGYRPLLLNMANKDNPGGGYRKGDGAQEENLFRRSDYYQSLDVEIADNDRSERLHCNAKCDLKSTASHSNLYPMEEFGAIYTSGITVFRRTESEGYALMKDPLYNVCAIAMAAHRNPELKNNKTLTNKFAISTQKKIENIFAIAHHHEHDCLLLSALGCGAFKNPPGHVASIFKSVILQYAGFFDKIYFAIVDDHNTGNKINPKGNFLPFRQILNDLIIDAPTHFHVNMSFGPNRIINKSTGGQIILNDVCILDLPLCHHGGTCNEIRNLKHNNSYSHPPMCPHQNATSTCDKMGDEIHVFTFIHITKCEFGGKCTNTDPKHVTEYEHPEFCKDGGYCGNISQDHLNANRHVSLCRDGLTCPKHLKGDPVHCNSYRHCKSICSYDNCCINFHNKIHMENTIHSFRTPCPFTPYNCSMYVKFFQATDKETLSQQIQDHCLRFSHVCPYGRQCKNKDENHLVTSIHIARQLCLAGDHCTKLTQEDHLESFSHPDIRDIRLFCKYPGFECRQKSDGQHLKKYRHGRNHNHVGVAISNGLNSSINFVRNQSQMIKNVNNYVETSNWKKAKIPSDILDWIRALQPVHRCGKIIFESILIHGHVMSRDYMNLLRKPKYVARAVQQHSRVRLIFLKHNNTALKEIAYQLIEAIVVAEFEKAKGTGIKSVTTPLDPDHGYQMNMMEKKLKPALRDEDIDVIRSWAVKIAQASIKLHASPMGIGYDVDQKLGTDKHVFSILGPHRGHYYGDIIITFKQEIMSHPDANFSIQAGTSFHSANAYKHRPWLKDPINDDRRVDNFHSSKLHCSVPRYEYAAATELMALTGKDTQSMDVDLQAIIKRWMTVDSHEVFESHLPQLIPLNYIDCVYIPRNLFESLTPEAQQSARGAFKDSLIITNHSIDLTLIKPGTTIPLDATREPYQSYVLEQIFEKIQYRIDTPSSSRGTVITAASSRFEQHILVPMTISQSYTLYCLNKSKTQSTPDLTYIYWQALDGNMILTISNEKIEPDEEQPNLQCLICYVAEKPPAVSDDYHEAQSYLNNGYPWQHEINVPSANFKAKSNKFYQGCNTDDFFTFCLRISHKTGEVTLSHAGPNSVYNHQKIEYQFNKTELDLSTIDFIHISAGTQDVPIRNLTINFEPVIELHPSVDKDFKIDTSGLLKRQHDYTAHYVPTDKDPSLNSFVKKEPKPSRPVHRRPTTTTTDEPSFFSRLMDTFCCRNTNVNNSATSTSSKLPACRDSVYCLHQFSADHIAKLSHPCRFNELCRNKDTEPHLVHEQHNVPTCSNDEDCSEKANAIHRATYRHSKLPDYLIPCRYQTECRDKSSNHRMKYFHGETLPLIKRKEPSGYMYSASSTKPQRAPCRYGKDCRSMKDQQHTAKYSHPTS